MYFETPDKQRIFYELSGNEGEHLMLIHGNTFSSKFFNPLLKKLRKTYRLILVDMAGHGRSSRLNQFPINFWEFQAQVLLNLLENLGIKKTHLLGCSGGGIIALNMALRDPEKIIRIVADSIPGESTVPGNIDILLMDRKNGHKKFTKRMFWKIMHGKDWKEVIENDTKMLEEFKQESLRFFSSDLSEIQVPVLLTGSEEDELIPLQESIYKELCNKNRNFTGVIFSKGKHPSMLSNKKVFIKTVNEFFRAEIPIKAQSILQHQIN